MRDLLAKLPPSVAALLIQITAILLVILCVNLTDLSINSLTFAILCGILAAALSYLGALASWWIFIQFAFAPALVFMLGFSFPPELFLGAFLLMLLIYWSTFRSQVPLYLSSKKVWQTLEEVLPSAEARATDGALKKFTFMDIGSGMGGVLTHLSSKRPDGLYFGVENAPMPFLLSWLRIKLGSFSNCQVRWESLWLVDLTEYDVVFAYLSPVPMEQLWQKVKSEMRPGTLFISNTFAVSNHPPQYTITLDDLHHSTLHIWHM